jgi:hypothetical protein
VLQATSAGEISAGQPGGRRRYYHDVVALNLKAQKEPKDVPVTLRRGVTLRGRLVGPDGKPVLKAVLLASGELLPPRGFSFPAGPRPVESLPGMRFITDGRYELPGCDPDKAYRVYFLNVHRDFAELGLGRRIIFAPDGTGSVSRERKAPVGDGKGRLGAAVEISARKAAGKPLTIPMVPCGTAEVRIVDAKGKPVQQSVWLELIVTPEQRQSKSILPAETMLRVMEAGDHLTFPALIPGATYRLRIPTRPSAQRKLEKEFTVASGKKVKLPDQIVPEDK